MPLIRFDGCVVREYVPPQRARSQERVSIPFEMESRGMTFLAGGENRPRGGGMLRVFKLFYCSEPEVYIATGFRNVRQFHLVYFRFCLSWLDRNKRTKVYPSTVWRALTRWRKPEI